MGDESSEARKAIGLFWDIENCHVPRNVSALSVVQRLRERFFAGLREAEFMCVCDINKEQKSVIEELNNGQVNVVHINATSKNTADDKIKQSLRRFADTHPPDTKIVLISSDVNFSTELSDLRHRKHFYIILIHKTQVHEALIHCAHEHYVYQDLLADLPRKPEPKLSQSLRLIVRGFPNEISLDLIRKRLKVLSSNCGGKVIQISHDRATLAFPTLEASCRAKRRMAGADVYGMPISITTCRVDDPIHSPTRFTTYGSARGRSESQDRQQYCDAPGAPGNSSPIKKFGSHHSNFGGGYNPAHNSYSSVAENISITQSYQTSRSYQGAEEGVGGDAYSSAKSVDYSQPSPVGLMGHQNYPDSQGGSASESHHHLHPPNLSEPPPAFQTLPGNGADGGMPGALNVSKTFNVTYQHHYNYYPRMAHPQPVYPYQNSLQPSVYNPGPRQAAKFTYDFSNRPGSRNGAAPGSFNPQSRPHTRSVSSTSDVFDDEDEDGLEMAYFKAQQQGEGDRPAPVDLTVTNLDYNISKKEWRKILAATFQPHVKVLGICVRTQPDNTSIASVKVPSVEDARFAISQIHRRKIGYKRIHVTLTEDKEQAPAESTRQETISVLSDAKGHTMPVFKFIENYEKRYHKSVSVSDLYKMKDVVEIMDRGGAGRMVKLARGVCPTPSPTPDDFTDVYQEENMDQPVCLYHCPEGSHLYAEAMSNGMLPNVKLQRKPFAAQVHSLLLGHNGFMPLMSFPMCYKAQFGSIPPSVEEGVYMEHLISCVPGVEIIVSKKGVKVIHFQEKKDPPGAEAICGRATPVMSQQMALLSREISDLLRQSRLCSIPASKFIPAYHHHFGRQCRVADYGYTKLAELFDALPHVLQVLGTGDRKVLTLSHRAQVKRFIADVLKVLKTQPGKQLSVADLPATYERMLFRKFDITHYGVAFIEDMFMDIPPTSILVTMEGNKTILAIPKRDQTPEEIKRTEQFALELVDLLKHNPHGRMTFNKFIPAYHHHFGRQCRVADYGFTRLTDLFESVSHVVEIVDDEEERMIKLTPPEMRMVLAEQITGLLRESPGMTLPLDQVLLTFQRQYGFPLRLSDFSVCDIKDLLAKIRHCVYVDTKERPPIVKLRPTSEMPVLAVQIIQLLIDQSGGCLPLVELCHRYRQTFGADCSVSEIMDELAEYVQVITEGDDGLSLIRLSALQILGRDIRALLRKVGSVPFVKFPHVYQEQYFVELKPALYGFPDVASLLRSLPHIVKVVGRAGRKFVELSPILGGGNEDEEVAKLDRVSSISRYEDPLSAPVPSGVPSPSLMPKQNFVAPDLMKFDDYADMFNLSAEEKRGLGTPLCRTPTSMMQSEFNSGPSPTPPQPSPDVFPGDVPLTSPFPPPPSFPVDMPPPNFAEGLAPMLAKQPPPPLSQPPLSSSAPDPNRPAFPFGSGAPPSQPSVKPMCTSELTPASLQWKERLEGGPVSFTPEQLNNLKSMKLLKRGDPEVGLAVVDTKPRPVSAPTYDTGNVQQKVQQGYGTGSITKPVDDSAMPTLPANGTVKMESAEAAITLADPSIIQSSLSVAPAFSAQPIFRMPQFGNGQFMEFKVPVPALGDLRISAAGLDKDASKQSLGQEADSLVRALKQTLSLTEDGEGDIAEKPSTQAAPIHTAEGRPIVGVRILSRDASSSSVGKDTSASTPVLSASLVEKSIQPQGVVLTPAGDASSSAVDGRDAPVSPSKPESSAGDSSSSTPVPANDSFSQDQPLETSSTRSARSGSKGSQGSISDSTSSSPSPRKNPRRAKIAAKFMNPGSGQ